MILWYLFYVVFVIGGLYMFIRLTMPANLRTIKITADGLDDAFYAQLLPLSHAIDEARKAAREK